MKKIFTNDKVFLTAVLVAATTLVTLAIHFLVGETLGNVRNGMFFLAFAICEIVLFLSYKKHEKNIMKGVMGALLMGLTCNWFYGLGVAPSSWGVAIGSAISAALMVTHFVINAGHKSKPITILINQILVAVFAAYSIFFTFIKIPADASTEVITDTVYSVISSIATAVSIICIESRLDAYRQNREKAGWTEETGYPEGYVHEHEKTVIIPKE